MVELVQLCEQIALQESVDPKLAKAIVTVESHWRPEVSRFEPHWKYLYFPREFASKLGITVETETVMQSMSIGLMQVMGSVARELGFKDNLSKLFDPKTNMTYGVRKLRTLLTKYSNEDDVIVSYNAGSPRKTAGGMYVNQQYHDKVSAELRKLRALK